MRHRRWWAAHESEAGSDLSICELRSLIESIVLQEDCTYPMPTYEGRRLAFPRYLDAVYFAQTARPLGPVIKGALERAKAAPLAGGACTERREVALINGGTSGGIVASD